MSNKSIFRDLKSRSTIKKSAALTFLTWARLHSMWRAGMPTHATYARNSESWCKMFLGNLFPTSIALYFRMFVISNSGSFFLGICRISCLHSHQVLCGGVNTELETWDCGQWSEGYFHSARYGHTLTSLPRTPWGQRKVGVLEGWPLWGGRGVMYHLCLIGYATFLTWKYPSCCWILCFHVTSLFSKTKNYESFCSSSFIKCKTL